jgi:concentrative nucleoside transporter, CNT family
MYRFISFIGIAVFIAIAWLLSENRKKVDFKIVINGLLIQFAFALFILKTPPGKMIFNFLNKIFSKMIDFTNAGSEFVFGGLTERVLFCFLNSADNNLFLFIFRGVILFWNFAVLCEDIRMDAGKGS